MQSTYTLPIAEIPGANTGALEVKVEQLTPQPSLVDSR